MIVDRSTEEEPLIPTEKTRIRLEMSRKLKMAAQRTKRAYDQESMRGVDLSSQDPSKCVNSNGPEPLQEAQTSKARHKTLELHSKVVAVSPGDLNNFGHKRYRWSTT